jgi:hypothetical protein
VIIRCLQILLLFSSCIRKSVALILINNCKMILSSIYGGSKETSWFELYELFVCWTICFCVLNYLFIVKLFICVLNYLVLNYIRLFRNMGELKKAEKP